jgi:hypothetical protein
MHTIWKEHAIKAALVDGMLASFGDAFVQEELAGGYFGAGSNEGGGSGGGGGGAKTKMRGGVSGIAKGAAAAAAGVSGKWEVVRSQFPVKTPVHHPLFQRQLSTTLEEKFAVHDAKVRAKEVLLEAAAESAEGDGLIVKE